ncbi:ABC transporter ATP-binding protein [Nocardioides deserti]|uniref:ATP-binding cassette domain-containing protein n=1 Tax=Nocardioides deserti TaxID=1588644 RepID=A0ABR6U5L3_9ACTN|nr:ATP-binding cassette domain-containing protein [Nocardioides deserti]MBC2959126.1 ATP-binding cassette domain-containing protein [Nocardioides deserti]GGO68636.1 ABC transporter ATP-binding protein [Nocardioides deserti]
MISVRGLTKQYGDVRAVDDLTFDVEPGKVTGFLGPNGAGKSTTMRMVLGLDRPTAGTATIAGRPYAALDAPLREVGALLDAGAVHPGRTGRAHLRIAARSNGIPLRRVEEVIGVVGLDPAARRRVRSYSLGMRQRLGIAGALLGDPPVLLFDEPVNGLDLDGVRWIRGLLRRFADEGRTVLVSSHLMSEMQLVADRLLVIGRGRMIADAAIDEVLHGLDGRRVRVRSPRVEELQAALAGRAETVRVADDEIEVRGLEVAAVGDAAHAARVPVHHLAEAEQSLEHAYLALTGDSVEHVGRLADTVAEVAR